MIIEEKQEIAASPKKVWEGLNDPDTLRACLPGCEEFELIEPNKFLVVMQAKIGPVKARFKGEIDLADINFKTEFSFNINTIFICVILFITYFLLW